VHVSVREELLKKKQSSIGYIPLVPSLLASGNLSSAQVSKDWLGQQSCVGGECFSARFTFYGPFNFNFKGDAFNPKPKPEH
jgi:hypothetical protein